MLTLDNLSCELDERTLFTGLSAQIVPGDLVHICGPNGAGKTTLLKIITGMFQSYAGRLCWGEQAIPCYDFFASLLYFGHAVGVKAALTPMENLHWYFGLNGQKSPRATTPLQPQHYLEALNQVGLAGYENVPADHLSAGQQRRIALARLYLSQAPLWVLDEPFTAIDAQGVAALEACLLAHSERGGMVVFTSHQNLPQSTPKQINLADYAQLDYRESPLW